ncbi:cysteine desulfurase [Catenovulum sp. SM1970]|uniref:aminotransferase class V-fold PLP-dependent enzyme n=1 Tax=Marinifaba aquimaris TaxID=2741323 RepID=UPI001572D6D5|nr:cysteine desulfurase [Marinifaba aquimaris]NTS78901.1 cysteine desulfurase [Marinifaba aquimaris]
MTMTQEMEPTSSTIFTEDELNAHQAFRHAFPFFRNNAELTYLDNAATTQKPQGMIDAIADYYANYNANVHRASHQVADKSTRAYEKAREDVRHFINAPSSKEIIWTKGTTESINLVAQSLAFSRYFRQGDEILVSALEHHANFVSWQQLCKKLKLKLVIAPVNAQGIDLNACLALINNKTKLVAISHVSNVLGSIQPINAIINKARLHKALTLVDGAQAIAHLPVDVQKLDCDFYAFSAHKVYGPTGLGVLYGKSEILNALTPYQYGGEMVSNVSTDDACFSELPHKFEAGTPNIADVIGLGATLNFIQAQDKTALALYEKKLYLALYQGLASIPGVKLQGSEKGTSAISFTVCDWHVQDIAELLSQMGFAVRVGTHCAQPLMQVLDTEKGTIRVSLCAYNTYAEIQALINALQSLEDFV